MTTSIGFHLRQSTIFMFQTLTAERWFPILSQTFQTQAKINTFNFSAISPSPFHFISLCFSAYTFYYIFYYISYSISISYSTSHCAPHVSQCASYGAQGVISLVVQGFSDTGGTMWVSSPTDSTGTLVDFHQQKSPGGAFRRLVRRNITLFTLEIGA